MLLARQAVPYTVVLPTRYGQMLVNRYDTNQANALFKTSEAFDRAEVQLFIDLANRLPEGATFLDIGANFGVFSLAVAQVLAQRGGQVRAFAWAIDRSIRSLVVVAGWCPSASMWRRDLTSCKRS